MRELSRRFTVIPALFLTCWIAAFGYTIHLFAAATDIAQQRGAALFHTSGCERCHSIDGVGGDRAPDLGNAGLERDGARIRAQILKGGHGMPPFAGVLSKEQVKDLVVFLSACRGAGASGCRQWLPAQ